VRAAGLVDRHRDEDLPHVRLGVGRDTPPACVAANEGDLKQVLGGRGVAGEQVREPHQRRRPDAYELIERGVAVPVAAHT
jgi:hypothetical protein